MAVGSRFLPARRPSPTARLQTMIGVIPASGGAPVYLCTIPNPSHLTWSSESQPVLCVAPHARGPQSSLTVFGIDAAADRTGPAGHPHPPVVLGPTITDTYCASGCRPVAGDHRVAIAIAEGMTTRLECLDPTTGERELLYAFPHGDIHEFSVAANAGAPTLAVIQSAGDTPPELHVGRPGRLTCVTRHHASLGDRVFGRQEPFHYTASDGLALDGQFIRPAGPSSAPWPTVVLPHGGPYDRSGSGFHLVWGQLLAMHGYAVLLPNYRGGLGRGEAFAAMARGDIGGAEFGDVLAAVDAAVARGLADDRRLGIGGWSQGGFLTAWGVTQTNRFKAGVMGAGISHWGMEVLTSDLPTFEAALAGGRPWDGAGASVP